MSKEHKHSAKRKDVYKVFALFAEPPNDDPIIYIGWSRTKDLGKLLRYLRSSCKRAAEFFEPGIEPSIFWLEENCMPKAVAYQFCIAWIRYFFENDFDVVTSKTLYEDALDLYGEAEAAYIRLSALPVEEVLQRRYIHSSKSSEEADEQPSTPPLSRRVSIRVT